MSREVRALLVDDNPHDRRLVVRELQKAYPDIRILEAVDQRQLDEQLVDASFDLVVTDFHLQWSDGIQVLTAVKKRVPDCPVIMFTGTGSEEIAVQAMKQGLDDYIIKNVKHLVRLRAAVQSVLNNAKMRRRADQLESRLESVLAQLRVGVFSCSPEGQFLDLNSAMLDLLGGETVGDVATMDLGRLFENGAEAELFLLRVLESEEPLESELVVASSGSGARYYRVSAKLADDTPGRIDGLVEDITPRKRAEVAARKSEIAAAQLAMLSPRETDVLSEVVAGNANKVIARHLDISEKTVEKHRSSVMKKLRVRSVAELVRLAMSAEASAGNVEPSNPNAHI